MELGRVEISIAGNPYKLARREVIKLAGLTARNWQMERVPVTSKRETRADVRDGDIPREHIITYDDWSRGVTGDHNPIIGTTHFCENMYPGDKGKLIAGGLQTSIPLADGGLNPCIVLEFNYRTFVIMGRYVYHINGMAQSTDKDFGAGVCVTDAVVFNNELVVCFGGATNKIQKRDAAGTWTAATDAVYADYFALVEDRLWRATATNEISNIANADNPLTLANWSSGITIGDNNTPITDLNGMGDQVLVSKIDGLYLGDVSAIFPNKLATAQFHTHPDNGKNTIVRGETEAFYPHEYGLFRYTGGSIEEVGIGQSLDAININDSVGVPGTKITALAPQGRYIWAATEPSSYRRLDPTGVRLTTDNESTFTDYTTEVADNAYGGGFGMVLSLLDTAANGDYFYVGLSGAQFYGMVCEVSANNVTPSVLTGAYWNGAAWAPFPIFIDGTSGGGTTLKQGGRIIWTLPSDVATAWSAKAIDGHTAYWVRFSVSVVLSSNVRIDEIRLIQDMPNAFLFRGRNRGMQDSPNRSIVWESIYHTGVATYNVLPYISALAIIKYGIYGLQNLVAVSRGYGFFWALPAAAPESILAESIGKCILAKHDAGMPEVNKQWLDVTIKGKTLDVSHTVDLYYRIDENTTWTALASNIAASPTTTALSGVTGRAIQLRIDTDATTHDELTEINQIEIRFRELPTYKNHYTAFLEVADGQAGIGIDASVQLANLQTAHGAGTITLLDPLGTSKSVIVSSVQVVEAWQDAEAMPGALVQITCSEV